MTTVGFIGAGSIGSHMANRVASAGFDLRVCDVSEQVRLDYEARGISTTRYADELADCEFIVVMVADDRQLEEVIYSERGLVHTIQPEAPPLLCIMSTVLPTTIQAIADRLSARGVRVADAPVSGGLARARDGELAIMVGAEADVFDALHGLLRSMGNEIYHCGKLGTGAATKLINNMLGIGNLYLAAEAYSLALGLDINLSKIVPIIEASTGRNFTSKSFDEAVSQYTAFTQIESVFHTLVGIVSKDLDLIEHVSAGTGLALPMLRGVAEGVEQMRDKAVADRVFSQWQQIANAKS